MTQVKPKVLITRPEKQGRQLAKVLNEYHVEHVCYPLFTYQPTLTTFEIEQQLKAANQPILIFVSVAAVEFAQRLLPLTSWFYDSVIAVGQATKNALLAVNISAQCPSIHDSEGLLALPSLQSVNNRDIIIVRGDGGRELIEQTLTVRGANVRYIECYKRQWHSIAQHTIDSWRRDNINTIVITSNALLKSVVHLLKQHDNYWQNTCLWVVASERIANQAHAYGLQHVVNANGANDHAISTAILKYGIDQ